MNKTYESSEFTTPPFHESVQPELADFIRQNDILRQQLQQFSEQKQFNFKIKRHYSKIFNLHDAKEAQECSRTLTRLFDKISKGKSFIISSSLNILRKHDGDYWHRYLEWVDVETSPKENLDIGAADE